jgi:hypothetical protein
MLVALRRGMLAVLLARCPMAFAADPVEECKALWRSASRPADYQQFLIKLQEIRGTSRLARTFELDYMTGTSLCRIGYPNDGMQILEYVLRADIPDATKAVVKHEIEVCAKAASAPQHPATIVIGLGPSIHGSGGHLDQALILQPIKARSVSETEIASRLFRIADASAAIAAMQERVGPDFHVVSTGRFVIAGQYLRREELIGIGQELEQYVQFYRSRYDMSVPDKIISIYAAGEVGQVDAWAAQQHGVILPPDIWDYSVYSDLSISAAIANREDIGPLAHELLHLMIRETFDDCPAWLEEGLARAYTTSNIGPGDITAGWDRHLHALVRSRPSLEELFKTDWRSFNVRGENLHTPEADQVATIQALARCFILYLQDRNALRDVYFAVRNGRIGLVGASYTPDGRLVEGVLHKPVKDVESDFNTWLIHK